MQVSIVLVVLALLHSVLFAAEVKDPDKVLRRLQYSYTPQEVQQLRAHSAKDFMGARIAQVEQDVQARAKAPQPSMVALLEQEYHNLQGVKVLPADQASTQQRNNGKWKTEVMAQTVEDSLGFYLNTPNGLTARWLWFWSNHFSVHSYKGYVRLFLRHYETNGIGAHVLGTFPELLKSAALHPAMLVYLDNQQNRKDKLNENLAREILELHTLGEGQGYTQADVQALAKALTGYTAPKINEPGSGNLCRKAGCVAVGDSGALFDPSLHDTSNKVFMGKTYAGRADGLELFDMLNDIALNPATAQRIAKRMAVYFVGDEPPPALVEQLKKVYIKSGGNLKMMLSELLTHPSFLQAQHRWVSDPFNHWVGQLRDLKSLGIDCPPNALLRFLRQTGAAHYGRISPDGYPLTSEYWDSASTLSIRLDVADAVVSTLGKHNKQQGNDFNRTKVLEALKAKLGQSSQQSMRPYEKDWARWLNLYLVSPEVVYF